MTLVAVALGVAGTAGVAAAQSGLSGVRGGLGLKPPRGFESPLSVRALGSEPSRAWQSGLPSEYGVRGAPRLPRLGLRPTESYGAVFYRLTEGWGSSVEAGIIPESWVAPRRYSLTGEIHTAFAGGRGLSVGLRYRVYEGGGETAAPLGGSYALSSWRIPGFTLGPSYQLQLSYQYSAASTFGLALGRDLETFTPGFEVPANGLRQLTFTGQHWLTPSWALSYDLLSNDPANSFRVQGLRLGVRYRF